MFRKRQILTLLVQRRHTDYEVSALSITTVAFEPQHSDTLHHFGHESFSETTVAARTRLSCDDLQFGANYLSLRVSNSLRYSPATLLLSSTD